MTNTIHWYWLRAQKRNTYTPKYIFALKGKSQHKISIYTIDFFITNTILIICTIKKKTYHIYDICFKSSRFGYRSVLVLTKRAKKGHQIDQLMQWVNKI